MSLLPSDEDWAIFTDGDMCFLTEDWGDHIKEFIRLNPNAGLITCYTNRIGYKRQRYDGIFSGDMDIRNHSILAQKIKYEGHVKSKPMEGSIGGFFFGLKKETWNEIKFDETIGMLGVDADYSERILKSGRSILLMKGLYVFHCYRLINGRKNRNHLLLPNGKLYNNNSKYAYLNEK